MCAEAVNISAEWPCWQLTVH